MLYITLENVKDSYNDGFYIAICVSISSWEGDSSTIKVHKVFMDFHSLRAYRSASPFVALLLFNFDVTWPRLLFKLNS